MVSASSMSNTERVQFDAALIQKLDRQGPRYTSYPTADRFGAFAYGDYLQAVTGLRARGSRQPLSLYLHIPFCDTICYYCACNKIVTKDRAKAALYLDYLQREIELQGTLFAGMNKIDQLHIGGGTPTYLSDKQMGALMNRVRRSFQLAPDDIGEYAIEIDPRTVSRERIASLRAQGFNRLSLGVQDFDPAVQKAVNRIQPEYMTLDAMQAARDAGFHSVSIDLIYGLPMQNTFSMQQTLSKVVAAGPDRIAFYNYAHLPHLFKPQRRIRDADLPSAQTRLEMLGLGIRRLTEAGYVYIGMDHFAKPTDALAIAQQQGRLHRNFQGYSTHADADMVACGVSAIGAVAATYSQNAKTLDEYYERLDRRELPIVRGISLSMDDALRRLIIQTLMCNNEVSMASVELAYPITFLEYFSAEMTQLRELEADGLITIDAPWLSVTPRGRLLIRNICMVFDFYLTQPRGSVDNPLRFSRTI